MKVWKAKPTRVSLLFCPVAISFSSSLFKRGSILHIIEVISINPLIVFLILHHVLEIVSSETLRPSRPLVSLLHYHAHSDPISIYTHALYRQIGLGRAGLLFSSSLSKQRFIIISLDWIGRSAPRICAFIFYVASSLSGPFGFPCGSWKILE